MQRPHTTKPKIKFRFWCPAAKKFIREYRYNGLVDELFNEKDFDVLIPQQFTGLTDRNGKEVYEGDVLQFKYRVGDFAWEQMDERETEYQNSIIDKLFVGTVERALDGSVNLEIVSNNVYFPILYVRDAVVIGNIFENVFEQSSEETAPEYP